MRKRFELDNKLWKLATYLHPKSVMSYTARAEMPFLRVLINCAPRLDSFDKKQSTNNINGQQYSGTIFSKYFILTAMLLNFSSIL